MKHYHPNCRFFLFGTEVTKEEYLAYHAPWHHKLRNAVARFIAVKNKENEHA